MELEQKPDSNIQDKLEKIDVTVLEGLLQDKQKQMQKAVPQVSKDKTNQDELQQIVEEVKKQEQEIEEVEQATDDVREKQYVDQLDVVQTAQLE